MSFEYEAFIDADVETVWHALRDKDQIRRWHGWIVDELDAEIDLIYFTGVMESGHTLTLGDGSSFTLTDHNGRTLLRLTRAPKGDNPEWDAYYEDINEGWTTFIQQLRFAVERHPGADRQTVYLQHDPGDGKVQQIFGLVEGLEPGAGYAIAAPSGEQLKGEVWFRSANQVGLTVSGWGDGLLVAGSVPVSQSHPDGGDMMVLTSYATGAVPEPAWRTWWTAR